MDRRNLSVEILSIARGIKLLLMDCDGVLTDGRLYFSAQGETMKVFNVRDGQGLADWHREGFVSGIISGRDAGEIISVRAKELGIKHICVASPDKIQDLETIINLEGVSAGEVAFIGDDTGDLGVMSRVGLPAAVADADPSLKVAASIVTEKNGGRGAVREVIDFILNAKLSDE
ncbi:MAG: HAD hydrolase family protein [Pyrinomonadaceae bacterium]